MSTKTNEENSLESHVREVERAVAENWGAFLAQGVILIVLGAIALIWPQISSVAVSAYVAWAFVIGGASGVLAAFYASASTSEIVWGVISAALALMVGLVMLMHPVSSTVSLTLVLIAFFIVEGIVQIVIALRYRESLPNRWGWMLFSGIVDLVLAGIAISGMPESSGWMLGVFAGANLLSTGIAVTVTAIEARRVAESVRKNLA